MSEYARDVREPLTFSTAQPGWRALFVDPADNTSHFTVPVLGWSLFRITVHDEDTDDQLPLARTRLQAVVLDQGAPVNVFEYVTDHILWWYLSPEEPDPEPGTVPNGQEPGRGRKGGKGKGGRDGERGKRPPNYRFAPARP
jgi:hypothetical protein